MALDLRTGEFRGGRSWTRASPTRRWAALPLSRTMSPDGRWAYTLYSGDENFVHALDTADGQARCIDLPGRYFSSQPCGSTGQPLQVGGRRRRSTYSTFELVKAAAAATATPRATAGTTPAKPADGGHPIGPAVALRSGRSRAACDCSPAG